MIFFPHRGRSVYEKTRLPTEIHPLRKGEGDEKKRLSIKTSDRMAEARK